MEITAGYTKNDWTVTGSPYPTKRGMYAECTCSCGKVKHVKLGNIVSDRSKSCGHGNGSWNVTHGMAGTPTYKSWQHMLERTRNPNCHDWENYGGRGISACERWGDFSNFLADMGVKPRGKTLDRIDVNGNYEPSNCRWATSKVQSRNTRRALMIAFQGESLPLAEWAERIGVEYTTLYQRLHSWGWSVEKSLTTPTLPQDRKHSKSTIRKLQRVSEAGMQVACPNCGTTGGKTIMMRWHFDRCRKVA